MVIWYAIFAIIVISELVLLVLFKLKRLPGGNQYLAAGGGVLVLISVAIFLTQFFLFMEKQQIAHWPRVPAKIVEAKIVGKNAVRPLFTYQYQVGDSLYHGTTDLDTPPFGARNKRALTARAIIREHPVGSALTIAYDPQHPQISTASLHLPWNYYMKLGLAMVLTIIGLYFVLTRFIGIKK